MGKYFVSGIKCVSCEKKISQYLSNSGFEVPKFEDLGSNQRLLITEKSIDLDLLNSKLPEFKFSSNKSEIVSKYQQLIPLFVIISYILGGVLLRAGYTRNFSLDALMSNFMGAFFIVFSLFKMINLSGFAKSFAVYDIIAKRYKEYALAYPFIELILGVLYLTNIFPTFTNFATLLIMSVGTIGVYQSVLSKKEIKCACLGSNLNLPMTWITIIENSIMIFMAALSLL